jgi:hypothetical protein
MSETVRDLLEAVGKEAAFAALFRQWPDEEKNLAGYERAWGIIQAAVPEPTTMVCALYQGKDLFDDASYYGVHGRAPDGEAWGIEYRPWAEWLGMSVRNETGTDVPAADFAGAILYEMTWAGYEPDEVQERFDEIVDAVEEVRASIEDASPAPCADGCDRREG